MFRLGTDRYKQVTEKAASTRQLLRIFVCRLWKFSFLIALQNNLLNTQNSALLDSENLDPSLYCLTVSIKAWCLLFCHFVN